jgi:hypothetical protein
MCDVFIAIQQVFSYIKLVKISKILYASGLIFIFIACSKDAGFIDKDNHTIKEINGIIQIENKNVPSLPQDELKFKLEKKFSINQYDHKLAWCYINVGSNGNLYLTNRENPSKVFTCIFDSTGIFLNKFGKKGQGPGEISNFISAFYIFSDNLYIQDHWTKTNVYSLHGDFIKSYPYENYLEKAIELDSINLLVQRQFITKSDDIFFDTRQICIIGKDMELKKIIAEESYYDKDIESYSFYDEYFDSHPKFTFCRGENEIFIAERSPDLYKIQVLDFEGNLKYSFSKKFTKIRFSFFEKSLMKKIMIKRQIRPVELSYKSIIKWMSYDKYGRLWVHVADDNDYKFDIFEKGIYLNSIILGFKNDSGEFSEYTKYSDLLDYGRDYFLFGDKFYFYSYSDENEILVYDY